MAGKPSSSGTKIDYDADAKITFETSKDVKVVASFDQMGLREELLRGIYSLGFDRPSAIQQRSIIPMIKGRDLIAQVCVCVRVCVRACASVTFTSKA